jgi:hypothetical protein
MPKCYDNVLIWPRISKMHEVYNNPIISALPQYAEYANGYPYTMTFWVKYQNPAYQPLESDNFWTARHYREE